MWKENIKKIPSLGQLAFSLYIKLVMRTKFSSSAAYWEKRYKKGGTSGDGSYDHLALYKAEILNEFVAENGITAVMEFGCGDGNQLRYFRFPSYTGFDISQTAIERCRALFSGDGTKRFNLLSSWNNETADLVLSLDVVYHLVEDEVFHAYMTTLFAASDRFVIIYSNNTSDNSYKGRAPHVKNRRFTDWIEQHAPAFTLYKHIPNRYASPSFGHRACYTDFFIYQKTS